MNFLAKPQSNGTTESALAAPPWRLKIHHRRSNTVSENQAFEHLGCSSYYSTCGEHSISKIIMTSFTDNMIQ
jgi:hypothetical protein